MKTIHTQHLSIWKKILSVSLFPIILLSSIGTAIIAISSDFDLNITLFTIYLCILITLSIAELIIPRNNISIIFKRDIIFTVISNLASKVSLIIATTITIALSDYISFFEKLDIALWKEIILAILITELTIYSLHRFMHRKNNFFWKIHSIHHLPKQIYTLMQSVIHPLNMIFVFAILNIFLQLAGLAIEAIFIAILLITIMSAIGHTNANLKLGFLNYMFQGPDLHHFHHSQNINESNKNLGASLTLFDIIFKTFYYYPHNYADKIGITNGDKEYAQENTIKEQLLIPFKK